MSESEESPSEIVSDAPNVHAVTDEKLRELLVQVSLAAYRSAKYRGQFNASRVDALGQQIIERKVNNWYEQNKDEYL